MGILVITLGDRSSILQNPGCSDPIISGPPPSRRCPSDWNFIFGRAMAATLPLMAIRWCALILRRLGDVGDTLPILQLMRLRSSRTLRQQDTPDSCPVMMGSSKGAKMKEHAYQNVKSDM